MRPTDLIRAGRGVLPTVFTFLALVAGSSSLFCSLFSISADVVNPDPWRLRAALLIMLALILDGLDGNLARWLKAESPLGAELDTFVDLTAFGIAPAVLMYSIADGIPVPIRAALGIALIASGAWRLARFKTADPYRGQRGYLGLPITVGASVVALAALLAARAPQQEIIPTLFLASGPAAWAWLGCMAILAFLQVSHLRYPKPSKHPVLFVSGVLLIAALWTPLPALSTGAAWLGLVLALLFSLAAPFVYRPPAPE